MKKKNIKWLGIVLFLLMIIGVYNPVNKNEGAEEVAANLIYDVLEIMSKDDISLFYSTGEYLSGNKLLEGYSEMSGRINDIEINSIAYMETNKSDEMKALVFVDYSVNCQEGKGRIKIIIRTNDEKSLSSEWQSMEAGYLPIMALEYQKMEKEFGEVLSYNNFVKNNYDGMVNVNKNTVEDKINKKLKQKVIKIDNSSYKNNLANTNMIFANQIDNNQLYKNNSKEYLLKYFKFIEGNQNNEYDVLECTVEDDCAIYQVVGMNGGIFGDYSVNTTNGIILDYMTDEIYVNIDGS